MVFDAFPIYSQLPKDLGIEVKENMAMKSRKKACLRQFKLNASVDLQNQRAVISLL